MVGLAPLRAFESIGVVAVGTVTTCRCQSLDPLGRSDRRERRREVEQSNEDAEGTSWNHPIDWKSQSASVAGSYSAARLPWADC